MNDRSGADIAVLSGAAILGTFTTAAVSAYAGVTSQQAESVLQAFPDLVGADQLPVSASGGHRWRVRNRDALRRRIRALHHDRATAAPRTVDKSNHATELASDIETAEDYCVRACREQDPRRRRLAAQTAINLTIGVLPHAELPYWQVRLDVLALPVASVAGSSERSNLTDRARVVAALATLASAVADDVPVRDEELSIGARVVASSVPWLSREQCASAFDALATIAADAGRPPPGWYVTPSRQPPSAARPELSGTTWVPVEASGGPTHAWLPAWAVALRPRLIPPMIVLTADRTGMTELLARVRSELRWRALVAALSPRPPGTPIAGVVHVDSRRGFRPLARQLRRAVRRYSGSSGWTADLPATRRIDYVGTLVARCWADVIRFSQGGHDPAALDEALRVFALVPHTERHRTKLAAALVMEQMAAMMLSEPSVLARAVILADIADEDPDPLPDWPEAAAAVRVMDLFSKFENGQSGFDLRDALVTVERLSAEVGNRQPYASVFAMVRLALYQALPQPIDSTVTVRNRPEDAGHQPRGGRRHDDGSTRSGVRSSDGRSLDDPGAGAPREPMSSDDALAVARCGELVRRVLTGPIDVVAFDAALAELYRLPRDLPATSALAADLVTALMRLSASADAGGRFEEMRPLLEIADRNPSPRPEWPQLRAVAQRLAILRSAARSGPLTVDAALAALDELPAPTDDNAELLDRISRLSLAYIRAADADDMSALRRSEDGLASLAAEVAGNPALAPYANLLRDMTAITSAMQGGDFAAAFQALAKLRARDSIPNELRRSLEQSFAAADVLRLLITRSPGEVPAAPSTEQLERIRALLDRPSTTEDERAMLRGVLALTAVGDGHQPDLDRIDAGIAELRRALLYAPPGGQRAMYLVSLALGLMRRGEATGLLDDFDEAAGLLGEAQGLLVTPTDPMWQIVDDSLSWIHQRLGDGPAARRTTLDSLRSRALRVLVQSDPTLAADAARMAAADAIDVARWCLRDGNPGDAVLALETGRGLMLFAATELRDLATQLEGAGRPDLAARWRKAIVAGGLDAVSSDLRREALTATADRPKATMGVGDEHAGADPSGLLEPPSLPEIRAALAALDADALVYLVPGDESVSGAAVIVPVDGPPAYLALHHLQVDGRADDRLADNASAPRDGEVLVGRLDAQCDWAWRAAIGPLLERYLDTRPAPAQRPFRVILVPVGKLAGIPWQAARRPDGRYAIELAAFSHTASARMLVNSAALPPVPQGPVGLVVADPDTGHFASGLAGARFESYAIHRVFYPGSRYLGRRPDSTTSPSGAGSGQEVRAWLTSTDPAAGAMLHLACHGVVQTSQPETYVVLAGGDRLAADELIPLLAANPDRAIGLVVLSASHSGVSAYGHDEAYSLGTAFLAGGVRSVVSTRWAIPDSAGSAFAFMFHHFLVAEGHPVWDALRRAQLWMLDPEREAPATMPRPLANLLAGTDLAAVVAWAGYMHWGQ
jgi:hypothetical protein